RAPRPHRRARHGARLPVDSRARPARTSVQCLLGARAEDPRAARHAPRTCAGADCRDRRPFPPAAERHAAARRRPVTPAGRAGVDAGGSARADARRPAGGLATRTAAMNVLVTGGTGYLGRAVVRALAARGHTCVVFARSASRSGLPGTLVDGDVRDRGALDRAASGCDALCHAAALVSIWRRRRAEFDDVNVGGLRNAIGVVTARRISRFLYTSSFLALPPRDRPSPMAANDHQRTKLDADRGADAAVADGVPLIRVYPGVVYGPGSLTEGNLVGRLIADHLRRRLPGLIGPEHRWSYAYVDDVATGHCAA